MPILTADLAFVIFVLPCKVGYGRPTKWTPIIPLLDPILYACGMEIMSLIAPQLSDCVRFLIVHKAYYAVFLVLEYLRIVLGATQGC